VGGVSCALTARMASSSSLGQECDHLLFLIISIAS
jgi:hypothetical protein